MALEFSGTRRGWRPATLIAVVSLWIASAGNAALWMALHRVGLLDSPRGWLFGLALGAMTALVLAALSAFFAWRHTLKPWLAFLAIATALGAHFMLTYSVVIDPTMMTNVVQTDPREVRDLLSPRMAVIIGVLAGVPLLLLWRVPLREEPRFARRLAGNAVLLGTSLALFVVLLVASFQPLSSTMRNHKHVRYLINPLNSLYAVGRLAAAPLERGNKPMVAVGTDASLAPPRAGADPAKPPVLLLVVGETARSDHFSLNGYARPTTPELAKLDVLSFRNAWSCGTSTAASLPCMFSPLGKEGFEARDAEHENLLDVLQRAGLAVLWLDNQSGCKGVCERVPNATTAGTKEPALCDGGECFDMALLHDLDTRLAALPAERRARGTVIVMHQMGSHGPAYHKRSPPAFKRFTPECRSAALQDCAREHVVNAYDNTIAYTDHVLAAAIGWLRQREAAVDGALLYVSDHGESLGENNLYLHGLPYAIAPDAQKHVPWIGWFGAGFALRNGLDAACLRGRLDERLSHDHLFHSTLALMDVKTSAYDAKLDAYAPCRR